MTTYTMIIVLPIECVPDFDIIGVATGYGAGNLTIELSATGGTPATHMALSARPDSEFTSLVQSIMARTPPLALSGAYPMQLENLAANARVSIDPDDSKNLMLFETLIDEMGLQNVRPALQF